MRPVTQNLPVLALHDLCLTVIFDLTHALRARLHRHTISLPDNVLNVLPLTWLMIRRPVFQQVHVFV